MTFAIVVSVAAFLAAARVASRTHAYLEAHRYPAWDELVVFERAVANRTAAWLVMALMAASWVGMVLIWMSKG